jgi:hypothetical protein
MRKLKQVLRPEVKSPLTIDDVEKRVNEEWVKDWVKVVRRTKVLYKDSD